jgi:hypothetical protein
MKYFEHFQFSPSSCREELSGLKELLETQSDLSETKEILPFFQKSKHVSAFIGSYAPQMTRFDRLAFEYELFGDFSADLVIGDSVKRHSCFIEFEDAGKNSVFKQTNRASSEWSSRFEHGFSQIVDWFWKLEDMKQTSDFRNRFGQEYISYSGLLIIGRDRYLSQMDKSRLKWRMDKVQIDSKPLFCLTLDNLYDDLNSRLGFYEAAYQADQNLEAH